MLLIVCLALPSPSVAQEAEPIDTDNELLLRGLQFMEQVEYERAVEVLSAALLEQGNTTEELVVIYRTLGTLYVYLGRQDEAGAAFGRLLCEDPEWRFSEYASPRVRELFETVRGRWVQAGRPCERRAQPSVEPVTIDHESPNEAEPGESLELQLTVEDPGQRVTAVALRYRATGEEGYNELGAMSVGPGAYVVTIPGDAIQPPAAEYYLEARDGEGEVAATLGTSRAPLRVPVEDQSDGGGTSIARTWWFWTIIGVAVAGTALGLGLGLGLQGEPPSQDHTVTVRICDAEEPGSCFN